MPYTYSMVESKELQRAIGMLYGDAFKKALIQTLKDKTLTNHEYDLLHECVCLTLDVGVEENTLSH